MFHLKACDTGVGRGVGGECGNPGIYMIKWKE